MSHEERKNLIELLQEYQTRQDAQHQEFRDTLQEVKRQNEELKEQLAPIADIYSSFKGFGGITLGFVKYIVTPIAIVIGLILSVKNFK